MSSLYSSSFRGFLSKTSTRDTFYCISSGLTYGDSNNKEKKKPLNLENGIVRKVKGGGGGYVLIEYV
jgi:hypothetical protein